MMTRIDLLKKGAVTSVVVGMLIVLGFAEAESSDKTVVGEQTEESSVCKPSVADCGNIEGQSKEGTTNVDILAQVKEQIIPKEGQDTSYGMPLSLNNTEKFRDYNKNITLSSDQRKIKKEALSTIPAPCCPNNPISTCCCPCNLAKTTWGLSKYLIKKKNYNAEQVRQAALEWLHFTSEEHYIREELKRRGINPRSVGLTPRKPACYAQGCELPFKNGGCGGML